LIEAAMQKHSKPITLMQYLVVAVILIMAAVLRLQGLASQPSGEPSEATNLPQIHVEVPTATEAPTDAWTESPQPTLEPTPVSANSTALIPTDKLDDFDFFVLALSWSPDYCATNGDNDPQQCSIGKKLGFVLHGLWPQYNKGYPSNCSTEKMPEAVKDQFPGLYPNDNLFDHEWEKHGTCTGLSPIEYLQAGKALKETVVIPAEFRAPEKPFRISVAQLKDLFTQANPDYPAEAFLVSCSSSGRYLKEIYICFSREGLPAACSAEMQKTAQKSCQAKDFLVRNTR
jgi:ribonuclease T2